MESDAQQSIMEAGVSKDDKNEQSPLLGSKVTRDNQGRLRRAAKKIMKEPHVMNWAKLENEFNMADIWTKR